MKQRGLAIGFSLNRRTLPSRLLESLRMSWKPPALLESQTTDRLVEAVIVRMREAAPRALAGILADSDCAVERTTPETMLVRFDHDLPERTALNRVTRALGLARAHGQLSFEGDQQWNILLAAVPALAGVDRAPDWWLRAF